MDSRAYISVQDVDALITEGELEGLTAAEAWGKVGGGSRLAFLPWLSPSEPASRKGLATSPHQQAKRLQQ